MIYAFKSDFLKVRAQYSPSTKLPALKYKYRQRYTNRADINLLVQRLEMESR